MKRLKLITLWLLCLFIVTGCTKGSKATTDQAVEKITDNVTSMPSQPQENRTTGERAVELLSTMSLEEKVGQMLQGERNQVTGKDMTKLGLGSVLSGGGSYPGNNTIDDWNDMIKGLQDAALKTKHQIPMLYGVDAVHGLGLVKGAVVYPHNIGLGAANDPELMYKMGAAVAEEMKIIGVLWNFSPCVAVNTDPRWGRTYECYSSDPAIVASLSEAYLKGQTEHGVLATAKHYAADGGVAFGTGEGNNLIDRGDAVMSEEELRATHLLPYKNLVESGVKIIMASFSSYHGVKMHENKYLLTDVLKEEYGFQGFIVSDWEGVSGLSGASLKDNVILAVNAGIDMLMEPNRYKEVYEIIHDAVKSGAIKEDRINDAVRRILTVKIDAGLFDDPGMENTKPEVSELGSEGFRELAKKLVEKSLVLLKNKNSTLPLKKGRKVFVTGPAMNDIGLQCGGWGLTWQGLTDSDKGNKKVTEGTTILEGLEEYAEKTGFEVITDKDRAGEADLVILAIGEKPYAEYAGDTKDLSITGSKACSGNKEAIEYAKALGKPTVTLIIAGRNVLINDYMDDWDSIVMCYLPGTQGDGIASVLTGETTFTGRLPMPYYKSTEDIGKKDAPLLYETGYGLTY